MLKAVFVASAALFGVAGGQTIAQAATIHYTPDSFTDGVSGWIVGGPNSTFELYGIGYTQIDSTLYVGLNTNLPIGGSPNSQVQGGTVTWGDMFFNFSTQPFAIAVETDQVYGVRFDAHNDSSMPHLGLYQVQQTGSVTSDNSGFDALAQYQSVVTSAGGTPSLGAIPLDGSYLSASTLPQNVIAQGSLLAGQVSFIDDFSTVGLPSDFGFSTGLPQTGRYTYGFSVETGALPKGDFIAHLLAECANDAIAFRGTIAPTTISSDAESVPEPSTALTLLSITTLYGVSQGHRKSRRTSYGSLPQKV